MGNKRKVIVIKGTNDLIHSEEISSNPIERLEKLYIATYGQLPFTQHIELDEYMNKFSEQNSHVKIKLKSLRESKRITIPDMAMLLGISKDGYFKIESGTTNPKLDTAFKIAKLLDTTVDELFGV